MSDPVSSQEIREIEQFLFDEAWCLDERRFDDWLALFTDDARYWMPTRRAVAKAVVNTSTSVSEELAAPGETGWFEDSKLTLLARVMRLKGGIAWAEDPPSRTRRMVTNVQVEQVQPEPGDGEEEYRVRSYFMLHRTRHQMERETFVGCRNDLLRRVGGELRIAAREIILDETVLASPNLSVFF